MKTKWTFIAVLLLLAAPTGRAQFSYYTNSFDTNTITITGYSGPPWQVSIPTTINGLRITSIDQDAFDEVYSPAYFNLTSVTIPSSLTNIGLGAFYSCFNLTNATISNGVTSIGEGAFGFCNLTNVTLPNSLTSLGAYAFQGCGLTNVAIPSGVSNIGATPFTECNGLIAITVDSGNLYYSSVNGVLFDKSQTTLLEYPGGLNGSYRIPGSVTSIAVEAFLNCRPNSVTIPGSVTNIGAEAFEGCGALAAIYFTGNAPSASGLGYNDQATVYYLPGTTGWSNTFAGLPAVLWNPTIQASGASFGVKSNRFGFNIAESSEIPIAVEACTNLASPVWTPLQSLTLTNGLVYFKDLQWTNYHGRFYRITSP